jgi:hypothetical protein
MNARHPITILIWLIWLAGGSAWAACPERSLSIAGVTEVAGRETALPISMIGTGNENGLSFSLNFDPARLTYLGQMPGAGAVGTSLLVNTNQVSLGKLGLILAKPAGQSFVAGSNELVRIRFLLLGGAATTAVSFADAPLGREVVDTYANTLCADYSNAQVVITPLILPTILADPVSQTIQSITNIATNVTFSVTAGGSPPLLYQWRWNGANLVGASGTSLTLTNVGPSQAGNYDVVVANDGGAVTSQVAMLTLLPALVPPAILSNPRSQLVSTGETVYLTVAASGSPPMNYQWQRNSSNLDQATNALLVLTNIAVAQAGSYRAVVSNSVGSATSQTATLTVSTNLRVVRVVSSAVATAGTVEVPVELVGFGDESAVGFSLNVDPSALSFLGVRLGAGAGGAGLLLNTNSLGVGSIGVALTLQAGQTFASGTNQLVLVRFMAGSVSGPTTLAFGDLPIARELADVLANPRPVSFRDGVVNILATAPSITLDPQSLTVPIFSQAVFQAGVAGSTPLSYQWQWNGADLVAATGSALTLDNVTPSMAGGYRLIVTNAAGSATSGAATLTVPRVVRAGTTNGLTGNLVEMPIQLLAAGDENSVGFSLDFDPAQMIVAGVARGAALGGAALIFNTNRTGHVGVAVAQPNNAVFGFGTQEVARIQFLLGQQPGTNFPAWSDVPVARELVDTNANSLMVQFLPGAVGIQLVPPLVTRQPTTQTAWVGDTVTFDLAVSGSKPMIWQWQKNGADLPGATNAALTITNVQSGDGGNYSVRISSAAGVVSSASALLTVLSARPDLFVSGVTAPATAVAGQTVPVTWTLFNIGNADAPAGWWHTLWLAPDTAGDNPQFVAALQFTTSLAAGQSLSVTGLVVVPAAALGDRYFMVRADGSNNVAELNENNNVAVAAQSSHITSGDLVLAALSAPANAQAGQTVSVTWVVTNAANNPATGPWQDRLYLGSSPNSLAGAFTLLTVQAPASTLAGGAAYTNTQQVVLPASSQVSPGTYYLTALVDCFNTVMELTRTNNSGTAPIQLTADFVISASNNPPVAGTVAGTGYYFSGATSVLTAYPAPGYKFVNWTEGVTIVGTNITLTNVVDGDHLFVANYAEANVTHVVTTTTSPSGLATVTGAGTYTNGQSANITAPQSITNPPYIYNFRQFQLNGAPLSSGSSLTKTFSTLDPTNMQYVAVYSARSILPVITNVAVNYPLPVPATTNFVLQFQFDRSMDTTVAPLVVLTNPVATLQPVVPVGGLWSQTVLANDTFTVPAITFLPGMDGANTLVVSLARDPSGQVMSPTNVMNVLVEATPPGFVSVAASPSVIQCVVAWVTDKASSSQVEYGLTSAYVALTTLDASLVLNHSVTITGLRPNIVYHFRLHSKDHVGNEGISLDKTFTTPPDTMSPRAIFTGGPGQNSTVCVLPVTFTWSGSDDVTAATNLLFASQIDSAGFSAFSGLTSLTISNLTEGTHVLFVKARDEAGNIDPNPPSLTFTLNTATPTPSNLTSAPGPNYAVVTWRTSKPANSSVDYGPTSAYGQNVSSSQFLTSHSVTLTGLQASTPYHFRVTSVDSCGRSAVSSDLQFTTGPAPDLLVSSISAPSQAYTGSGFNVSWTDTNGGQGTAFGPWVDRVYLCHTNGLNTNTDQLLGEFSFLNQLTNGQAAQLVHSVAIDRAGLTNGLYYIAVYADGTNSVYEGFFETNNVGVSSATIAVQLTPLPDLVVSQITSPSSALGGQTISVGWTVCNQGTGDTDVPLWYDHLYLSSTTNVSGILADYGTFANPGYLVAGDCYDQSVTVTLPVGVGGVNYFIVKADSTGLLAEASDANNTAGAAHPIDIQEVLPGFLHVVSVQASPAAPTSVAPGQPVTVTWTVKNTGQTAITGSWDDEVTLSPTPTYDFVNGYWDVLHHIYFTGGTLAPGQTYSHSGTFNIPQGAASGNWYAVPVVDTHFFAGGTGAIGSGAIGRDQNSALIIVAPPTPSDLAVTGVTAPATAVAGRNITVAWSVSNNGVNATSASSWHDIVYLSAVTPFSVSQSVSLGALTHFGALDLGQNYSASQSLTIPANYLPTSSPSTTNYVYVVVDAGNAVLDYTRTNNVRAASPPIVIAPVPPLVPADLSVTSVGAPSLVVAGTTAAISWTVANQGAGTTSASNWVDSVYLTQNPTLNLATDIHLADLPHTGVLAGGGSYTASQLFNLTYCALGLYYVVVVTDSGHQVYEAGALGNNATSSLQQLWIYPSQAARIEVAAVNPPSSAQAGSPLAVSWTVHNLANAATNSPWYDAVYLSPVPQFNPGGSSLLGVYPHVGGLTSGGSYTVTQSPVVPRCFAGIYYVVVVTDVSNTVDNISCDTNNILVVASPTTVSPSSYPSLQLAGVSLPPGINAGSAWTLGWTVTNAGPGAATGSWFDAVYASLRPTLDTNALFLGQFGYSNNLASGATYSQSKSIPFPPCLSGSYYIFLITDVSNTVNAAACQANNRLVSASPVVVNFGVYPDLTVASVSPADTAYAGQGLPVSWSVTNVGMATATGPWTDSVYLLPSPTFDPATAVLLGSFAQTLPLAPGASYSQTVSPTLPNTTHGTYYVAVVTDSGNNVQECQGETNNVTVSATSVNVPVTLYPDLKVTSVQVPVAAYAGQNITVTWVVTNTGNDTTGATPWNDAIYLSLDQVLDPSDTRVGTFPRPQQLAAGQSYTNSAAVTLPSAVSGPYYILVLADSGGSLFEHLGYNDSLGWVVNPMVLTLPAPADLAATSVSVAPASGVPGTSMTINWNVSNLSTGMIYSTWSDAVYLSTNRVFDANAVLIATQNRSGLAGSGAYASSFTGPLPALTPGTYYAIVRADVRNTLHEPNLANNTGISTSSILADVPTMTLGQAVTNHVATGGAQYYKVSVPAGQTVRVTLNGSVSASQNELYVRYGAVPDLGNYDFLYNDPFSANQLVTIPTTQAGFYYIMVRGGYEPGGPLDFTLEADLVPFTVSGVTPGNIGDNGQVTITVTGARFLVGGAISLSSGTNLYVPQWTHVVDGSTLQARFFLTNATHGVYDVVLTNGDNAVATLPQAEIIQTALPVQAAAYNGFINLETRRGLPFRWNGYVMNVGNVDIPYLGVAVTTDPNYPVLLSPPVGAVSPAPSIPAYFYQNLPPGQALTFSFTVQNASALGVGYSVKPTAYTRADYLSGLAAQAEDVRSAFLTDTNALTYATTNTAGVITTNSAAFPPAFTTVLSDPIAWLNLIGQGYVAAGIMDPNDLAALIMAYGTTPAGPALRFRLSGKDLAGCLSDCFEHADIDAKGALAVAITCTTAAALGCIASGPGYLVCVAIAGGACLAGEAIALSLVNAHYAVCVKGCKRDNPPPCGSSSNGGPLPGSKSLVLSVKDGSGDGGGSADGQECKPPSKDPNEITGPLGYGAQAFAGVQQPWLYTVYCANESNAMAYARQVIITNQLDPNLDIFTFRVTEIAVANTVVTVPTNRSFFTTRIPAPAPNPTNVVIDISVGVNVFSHSIFCTMNAIDLTTGELVASVNQGVLAPNTTPPIGEGHITYTIKPSAGLVTGTVITNQASIVFDTNDPIDTNIATNSVDAIAPTSYMTALPVAETSTNFVVSWFGADDAAGSGIQNYDIYMSDNDGAYVPLLLATTANSTTFNGAPGHLYGFYSLARDNGNNVEATPLAAKTSTYVSANQPPVLNPITNQVISVGSSLTVTNIAAYPDGATNALLFGLLNGPPGLHIDPLTGILSFAPGSAQGGTTNLVTVGVTNNGFPPLSTTVSFLIIVPDYGQVNIGSGSVLAGQSGCVPLTLFSSTGLTNLSFNVRVPANRLTGLTFTPVAPAIGSSHLAMIDASNAVVTLATAPGMTLNGTLQLGNFCFTALSNQVMAVVPMLLSAPAATKADGTALSDMVAVSGQLAVVGRQPYLQATRLPGNLVQLTLYGIPGTTYILQTAPTLPGPWQTAQILTLTNVSETFLWPNQGEPALFFRLEQRDLAQLSLGSAAVLAGQGGCVPLTLLSTVSLTNLSFNVTASAGNLAGLTFTPVAPAIGSSHLAMINPSNAVVTVATAPGMTLNGTLPLGNLCFTALSNQVTAVVPMLLSAPAATKANGTALADIVAVSGRITVVGKQPYLEATRGPGNLVQLTLYGIPGTTYALQTAAAFLGPWQTVQTLTLTNVSQTLLWPVQGDAALFFRLEQQDVVGQRPYLEATRGPGNLMQLTLYGIPGTTNVLQTALSPKGPWSLVQTLSVTEAPQTLMWSNHLEPARFFRFYQQ